MLSKLVSQSSSSILEPSKSVACKFLSPTRVLFVTESHNFAIAADLNKIDGQALNLVDVRTFSFFAVGLSDCAFLNYANFLIEEGGFNVVSKEEEVPLFSNSSHSEYGLLGPGSTYE